MTAALGDRSSGSAGSGGRASPPQSAAGKQATATTGAGGEVRQRKVLSEERERRLEEMRDKLQSRKAKEQEEKQSQSGGIAEMVLLVFSVIAMAYAFSASFRSFVKTIVMDTFFPGQVVDGDDGQDSWGVVEDEGEAFF
ncbi:unnamed protein product [Polarella glacialis]|uniref:Uncharacterized protein n=1 Tax=Polarella glacialis TaxID=89957 RepID=A0A813D7R4_POLGL|nr:unnamed protein product [Polarella glacialis]